MPIEGSSDAQSASEAVLPADEAPSSALKRNQFKGDRRKLPPITRDLHTAHHDPVRKTLVVRRSRTAQERRQFLTSSSTRVGFEDEDQEFDEEEDLERPDSAKSYSDEEDVIAEVPDSIIVQSQMSRQKSATATVSREVNIFDDSGFDTDLETEPRRLRYLDISDVEEHEDDDAESGDGDTSVGKTVKKTEDHRAEVEYILNCEKSGLVPVGHFIREMHQNSVCLSHHGVGTEGMLPIAKALLQNSSITSINLSDNWLGRVGGLYICNMLKENCFLTEMDLSENRLEETFCEQLLECLNFNRTLSHLNLSGNKFGLKAAEHLAAIIGTNATLMSLNLSHNLFDAGAGVLLGPAIGDNSTMRTLDLSWNNICRRGAIAIAKGLKVNVCLKSFNLGWNGFALDGCKALGDALKVNNVLEELDLTNNRITTEAAVLVGKGISVNETLRVLRMGRNIMRSAGCYGVVAAVLRNPNSQIEELDFNEIIVNKDFTELLQELRTAWAEVRQIKVSTGCDVPQLKPKKRVHPMTKLRIYVQKHGLKLHEFFSRFDKDGSMAVSYDEFREGIQEMNINLDEDEVEMLILELDRDGDGDINYSELVIGNVEFEGGLG